jgi:16S rRNA processing protein RimM
LKGINSLEEAYKIAGNEVWIPEDMMNLPGKDKYYFFQIIGCSVITERKKNIGNVTDILLIEGNDILIVNKGKNRVLIPFTKSICKTINLEKKEIVISPPEGLLGLNEI